MFYWFKAETMTSVFNMVIYEVALCILLLVHGLFYYNVFKLASASCSIIQRKLHQNRRLLQKLEKYTRRMKTSKIAFWLTLHARSFLTIVLSTIFATLWISVLYYFESDNTKAALFLFFGITSTVLTAKYGFCGTKNMDDSLIKIMDLLEFLIILAGFCLLIFLRFWTTAVFYLIFLGKLVQRMRCEIQQLSSASNTHHYLNDHVPHEDAFQVELQNVKPFTQADKRDNDFSHQDEFIHCHEIIETLVQNVQDRKVKHSVNKISRKPISENSYPLPAPVDEMQERKEVEKSVDKIAQYPVFNDWYENLDSLPVHLPKSLEDEETHNHFVRELIEVSFQEVTDQGEHIDTLPVEVIERQHNNETSRDEFVVKRAPIELSKNTDSLKISNADGKAEKQLETSNEDIQQHALHFGENVDLLDSFNGTENKNRLNEKSDGIFKQHLPIHERNNIVPFNQGNMQDIGFSQKGEIQNMNPLEAYIGDSQNDNNRNKLNSELQLGLPHTGVNIDPLDVCNSNQATDSFTQKCEFTHPSESKAGSTELNESEAINFLQEVRSEPINCFQEIGSKLNDKYMDFFVPSNQESKELGDFLRRYEIHPAKTSDSQNVNNQENKPMKELALQSNEHFFEATMTAKEEGEHLSEKKNQSLELNQSEVLNFFQKNRSELVNIVQEIRSKLDDKYMKFSVPSNEESKEFHDLLQRYEINEVKTKDSQHVNNRENEPMQRNEHFFQAIMATKEGFEHLSDELSINENKNFPESELGMSCRKCVSKKDQGDESLSPTPVSSILDFKEWASVAAESLQSTEGLCDSRTNSDLRLQKHPPERNESTNFAINGVETNERETKSADVCNKTHCPSANYDVEGVVNRIDLSFIYAVGF